MHNEILSLLTEDHYGLWELQVQLQPDQAQTARVVGELLDAGLVAWFYRASDAGPAEHEGEGTPRRPDLGDGSLWRVPQSTEAQWLLGATASGKRAYFGTGA